jgi:hypothetical protein
MKISKLAAKPQLIKIKLSNKALVEKYKEEIEFHTWDRQPLTTFMELANTNANNGKPGDIIHLVKDLILDENGKPVIIDDTTIPTDVLLVAVGAIVERLGKL